MSLKICVLLITFILFEGGQAFLYRNTGNDKINEGTVKMIQDVFKEKYPQAAIDLYIKTMRQLYSKVPEEKEEGNLESIILLIEGALHRTQLRRVILSGNTRHYDVRSVVLKIGEKNGTSLDMEEFNEKTLETIKTALDKEFPSGVGQMISSVLTRALKAKTLAEAKTVAIDMTILSMDGARAVTNRYQQMKPM